MSLRKISMLEKVANNLGVLYRYEITLFPRQWYITKNVLIREIAPPTLKDWPAIKRDYAEVMRILDTTGYKKFYTEGDLSLCSRIY